MNNKLQNWLSAGIVLGVAGVVGMGLRDQISVGIDSLLTQSHHLEEGVQELKEETEDLKKRNEKTKKRIEELTDLGEEIDGLLDDIEEELGQKKDGFFPDFEPVEPEEDSTSYDLNPTLRLRLDFMNRKTELYKAEDENLGKLHELAELHARYEIEVDKSTPQDQMMERLLKGYFPALFTELQALKIHKDINDQYFYIHTVGTLIEQAELGEELKDEFAGQNPGMANFTERVKNAYKSVKTMLDAEFGSPEPREEKPVPAPSQPPILGLHT